MRKRNTLLQLVLGPQEPDCRRGRLHVRGCRTTIRRGRWHVRLSRRDPLGLIDRGHGNFAAGSSQKGIRIGLNEFQSQVVRGRSRGDVSPLRLCRSGPLLRLDGELIFNVAHWLGKRRRERVSGHGSMSLLGVCPGRPLPTAGPTPPGISHRTSTSRHSASPSQLFRRSHTVAPGPAVSCRLASPLTTATSSHPELPTTAISEPVGLSL